MVLHAERYTKHAEGEEPYAFRKRTPREGIVPEWDGLTQDPIYSWQWIGLDPNPIGLLLLDSTGFGSTWIWISICFRSIRIEFYWIEKRE